MRKEVWEKEGKRLNKPEAFRADWERTCVKFKNCIWVKSPSEGVKQLKP